LELNILQEFDEINQVRFFQSRRVILELREKEKVLLLG
jgi:hypothetical protein